jgi:hypothetical protein
MENRKNGGKNNTKIMEVRISKFPNHVEAKSQSLNSHSMAPAFRSIRLCNFHMAAAKKTEILLIFERKEMPARF